MTYKTPTHAEIDAHIRTAERLRSEYMTSLFRRVFRRKASRAPMAAQSA